MTMWTAKPILALRLLLPFLESIRHSAQFGKRTSIHLAHQIRAMNFHGGFRNANIVSDLLVQTTGSDLEHNLPLPGAERVETLPERTQRPVAIAPGAIAGEPGLDCI